ncbi:hypothetical protein D3C73_446960 [compost metagenome]
MIHREATKAYKEDLFMEYMDEKMDLISDPIPMSEEDVRIWQEGKITGVCHYEWAGDYKPTH